MHAMNDNPKKLEDIVQKILKRHYKVYYIQTLIQILQSSVHTDELLTWKIFTQIGHIVRKWDPNFKAVHPRLCQPNLLQGASKQVHKCIKKCPPLQTSFISTTWSFVSTIYKHFSNIIQLSKAPRHSTARQMWPHLKAGRAWGEEVCHPHHQSISDHGCTPGEPYLPVTLVWPNAQAIISTDANQYHCRASIYLAAILSLDET